MSVRRQGRSDTKTAQGSRKEPSVLFVLVSLVQATGFTCNPFFKSSNNLGRDLVKFKLSPRRRYGICGLDKEQTPEKINAMPGSL